MIPEQYEKYVSKHFKNEGYEVEITPYCSDYGTDLILSKGSSRTAVQVKMYGNSSRKINRRMVMEFCGSAKYFKCKKAIIVTDGAALSDAEMVAQKIGIQIFYLPSSNPFSKTIRRHSSKNFSSIWNNYIMPLEGKTLKRENGTTNKILCVDWSGITRITSNGKKQHIEVEIFKFAINHILKNGSITRKTINDQYDKRASSGITLILSQVPFFKLNRQMPMSIELLE